MTINVVKFGGANKWVERAIEIGERMESFCDLLVKLNFEIGLSKNI